MSNIVVSVEGLSKRYLIGHQVARRERYRDALRDVIGREARTFVRKAIDLFHGRQIVEGDEVEDFWALRDVSFEVKQGEIVGVIGRNGAGKTTLLKILSRIVEPSAGRVRLRGQVSSLLEVAGFHPELTGRENIFLNGAILGMSRREIRKKFDKIVAFAEVEQFLDTPIKRYSSGMYVRLAFAVAAHLDPDILMVDEILAVGDADFQKRCLQRMDDMSRREGRTVLFVSHNMESVLKFCSRGILLNSGRIATLGTIQDVLSFYLAKELSGSNVINLSTKPRSQELPCRVRLIQVKTLNGQGSWSIPFGQHVAFEICVQSQSAFENMELGIGLFSVRGFELASWTNRCSGINLALRAGLNVFLVEYTDMLLLPGQYSLSIGLRSGRGFEDYVSEAASFEITVSERAAKINAQGFGGVLVPKVTVSTIRNADAA